MLLEKTKIYGVDGVGQSNPTLTRTDAAVGLSYSIGASEISSDFNNCYPWSEMHEVTDEFGNVFIRIPKFYTKVTKNGNGTYKYQISGCRYDGFSTLFIDGKGNEIPYDWCGGIEEGSVQLTELNTALAAPGTQEAIDAAIAAFKAGTLKVFDTSTFTVGGQKLESYMADVDSDAAFTPDTEVIKDGYFNESGDRSAPYFDLIIDGITVLTESN